MSTPTNRRSSKLLSVRLTAADRTALDELATASDRTRTQLVRYALTAYLDTAPAAAPGTPPVEPDTTRHTALRLPADLAERVAATAAAWNGWTPSDILRAAVAAWLAAPNRTALGNPSEVAR